MISEIFIILCVFLFLKFSDSRVPGKSLSGIFTVMTSSVFSSSGRFLTVPPDFTNKTERSSVFTGGGGAVHSGRLILKDSFFTVISLYDRLPESGISGPEGASGGIYSDSGMFVIWIFISRTDFSSFFTEGMRGIVSSLCGFILRILSFTV